MNAGTASKRLDLRMVKDGLARSRSQAREAILRGAVQIDGVTALKAGQLVTPGHVVSCAGSDEPYVSRAALKLVCGLDLAGVTVAGKTCLDLGASTGGFSQVLLRRDAARVFAVDVGHGQFNADLKVDPRLVLLEKLNARELTLGHLQGARPEVIVADISFISLKLALPPALVLAAPGADLVALIKPQFEAGPDYVGRGGVVRDEGIHDKVCGEISQWLAETCGWRVGGMAPSPLTGASGNREFLIWARQPETT